MKPCKWLTFLFIGCLAVFQLGATSPKQSKRQPTGPLITIHAPHPEQFELAIDEVELDWSAQPSAKQQAPAQYAAPVAGAKIVERNGVRALVRVPPVMAPPDLLAIATNLKAANRGAEAHLVLYEPGLPRTKANRRLLTREVGVLLDPGEAPGVALQGLTVGPINSVPGVSGGYVVEAVDPLAALEMADALRQRPGVRSAYPLLKRFYVPR